MSVICERAEFVRVCPPLICLWGSMGNSIRGGFHVSFNASRPENVKLWLCRMYVTSMLHDVKAQNIITESYLQCNSQNILSSCGHGESLRRWCKDILDAHFTRLSTCQLGRVNITPPLILQSCNDLWKDSPARDKAGFHHSHHLWMDKGVHSQMNRLILATRLQKLICKREDRPY